MGIFDKKQEEAKAEVSPFEKVADKPVETSKPTPKPKKEKKAKAGNRAEALREQAKRLLEQAKRVEDEGATKIGKLVLKLADKDFAGFNLESFKTEINEIRGA